MSLARRLLGEPRSNALAHAGTATVSKLLPITEHRALPVLRVLFCTGWRRKHLPRRLHIPQSVNSSWDEAGPHLAVYAPEVVAQPGPADKQGRERSTSAPKRHPSHHHRLRHLGSTGARPLGRRHHSRSPPSSRSGRLPAGQGPHPLG